MGNDVIMDYPFSEPWRLDDLLRILDGYHVTLVDVTCDPDELARREAARGDRPTGSQRVFEHAERDMLVDTTSASAEQCAQQIVDRLGHISECRQAAGAEGAGRRLGRAHVRRLNRTSPLAWSSALNAGSWARWW